MDKFIMWGTNFGTQIGILSIDERNQMSLEFCDNPNIYDIPGDLYEEFEQGKKYAGDKSCRNLFKWLIMPPNRVNVEEELEKLDLKEYDLVEIIKRVKIDFPLPIKLERIKYA